MFCGFVVWFGFPIIIVELKIIYTFYIVWKILKRDNIRFFIQQPTEQIAHLL